ncbi:MAG: hypothetical protein H0W46_10430 [Acidimicrobiia bacterium]|nr:hypothetical protein [Acidimicrobiia bacterium]
MANLTVAIDGDVLRRARRRALDQHTSVNAIVRSHLEAYAGGQDVGTARRRLVELSRTVDAGSGDDGRVWTRDELYER